MSNRTKIGATVSVVIPCYNYGHFLGGCLASVLSQHGVSLRVLVIDDCSTDDSAEIAAGLCASDVRLEFRRHTDNVGLIATANEGLEWADGDHVVLLSADDLLVPGSLWRAAAIMEQHPNVGLVYGRPLLARDGRPFPKSSGRWRSTDVWSGHDWIHLRCKTGHSAMSSPEVVVRTSVQRAVGGYDKRCRHTSDVNMWLRVAAAADVAYVRGTPQAIYRIHSESMQRNHVGPLVDLHERKAAYDAFFDTSGSILDERDRLQTNAMRALAREALWWTLAAPSIMVSQSIRATTRVCPVCDRCLSRRKRAAGVARLDASSAVGPGRSGRFPPFPRHGCGASPRLLRPARRVRGFKASEVMAVRREPEESGSVWRAGFKLPKVLDHGLRDLVLER